MAIWPNSEHTRARRQMGLLLIKVYLICSRSAVSPAACSRETEAAAVSNKVELQARLHQNSNKYLEKICITS